MREKVFDKMQYPLIIMMIVMIAIVQSLNRVWHFVTPWTAAHQVSMSIAKYKIYLNSCPSSQWCHPTISCSVVAFSSLLQSCLASESFPVSQLFTSGGQSIGVSASVTILPMNWLISFRMDWLDLLAVQWTLKRLLQHHSSKASILWCSAFFTVHFSHPYMTTRKP